jgi:hypothetical protein
MNTHFNIRRTGRATVLTGTLALGLLVVPAAHAAVVGHWTFNEGEGTVAIDQSGQGNHGNILGGATFVASPSGLFSISLDGIDDTVNFGQPAILDFTNQGFTMEAWVAIDGVQTGDKHGIFGKSASSYRLGYRHFFALDRQYNVEITTAGGADVGCSEFEVANGNYDHVLATKPANAGGPIQFYLNGNLQTIECLPTLQDNLISEAVDVVAGTGNGNHLACQIDEIRVHDVFVDAAQALALFNAGRSTVPSNPFPASSEVTVPDRFSVAINSQEGLSYRLECTTDPVAPNWVAIGAFIRANISGSMFLVDPTEVDTGKLYRVVRQ